MKFFLILLVSFVLITPISAQNSPYFGKVDSLTFGECDDSSPVLPHENGYYGLSSGSPWLLFTRTTDVSSEIIGKRIFSGVSSIWDSTEVVISSTPSSSPQRNPDLTTARFWDGQKQHSFNFATWERNVNGHWNIFGSMMLDQDSMWSEPKQITDDTVDNTHAQIRAFSDSTLLLVWNRKNILLYSFITPYSISAPDTLAITTFDSIEFDVQSFYSYCTIVWTPKDTFGVNSIFIETIEAHPFSITSQEINVGYPIVDNPRMVPYFEPFILFETVIEGDREIMLKRGNYNVENISEDPLADNRNPCLFISPMITKRSTTSGVANIPFYGAAFTMERYTIADTTLIFMSGNESDTVKSEGYNRNVSLSSDFYSVNSHTSVLAVWESNRSGRSHIYSRLVGIVIDGVTEDDKSPNSFSLSQNYPNPFNPSTTFQFTIGSAADVSLKVYDLLGREVATVVNERFSAGSYSRQWNASKISSGVYFYRFQAGNYSDTKKLSVFK
jgi:hypothetical protein